MGGWKGPAGTEGGRCGLPRGAEPRRWRPLLSGRFQALVDVGDHVPGRLFLFEKDFLGESLLLINLASYL